MTEGQMRTVDGAFVQFDKLRNPNEVKFVKDMSRVVFKHLKEGRELKDLVVSKGRAKWIEDIRKHLCIPDFDEVSKLI